MIQSMKLVCFSNNTGGGLICDLLNNTHNLTENYNTNGRHHNAFKIGDTPSIELTINVDKWNNRIEKYNNQNAWLGTHQHPSVIPNLKEFEKVLVITTTHRHSKLYRWLRYYYGWYKLAHPDWSENNTLESIDKIRELAKNVFIPFAPYENCINIEFSKIVTGSFIKEYDLNLEYFKQWQDKNPWLYNVDRYCWAVNRFNEAEYEINNGVPFNYFNKYI